MIHETVGRWTPYSLREALECAEGLGIRPHESSRRIRDYNNVLPAGGRFRTIGAVSWLPALGEWRCYRRQGGNVMDHVTLLLVASGVVEKFAGRRPNTSALDPELWLTRNYGGFTYYEHRISRELTEQELVAEAGISLEVPDTVESLAIWTEADELLRRLA